MKHRAITALIILVMGIIGLTTYVLRAQAHMPMELAEDDVTWGYIKSLYRNNNGGTPPPTNTPPPPTNTPPPPTNK